MAERVTAARRMRALLDGNDPVIMPGCYDALSARIVEETGFQATLLGGFGVEAALLGSPDLGLITLTELADHARRITASIDIPVITDVDTGFGGVNNIARTVQMLERAGVAGLHMEDQVTPKKCPALPGRELVSIEEARGRYAAALEARQDPDFVIVARTDGDAVSYDESVRRANAYLEVGVDAILPMLMEVDGAAFASFDPDKQMEIIERLVADIHGPVMYVSEPPTGYDLTDLGRIGVKLVARASVALTAAASAMYEILSEVRDTSGHTAYDAAHPRHLAAGRPILDLMHVDRYLEFERRHTTRDPDDAAEREANR